MYGTVHTPKRLLQKQWYLPPLEARRNLALPPSPITEYGPPPVNTSFLQMQVEKENVAEI